MSSATSSQPVGELSDVILDCADLEQEGGFWGTVLGREIDEASRDDEWLSLSREGSGVRLSFQLVDGYRPPEWPGQGLPQQLHLDVKVDDLDAAEARIMQLGARRVVGGPLQERAQVDGPFRVYLDPAGHPFCLILHD